MHPSRDAAHMQQRVSTRYTDPFSFPPTSGFGLLGSTTPATAHAIPSQRSANQGENLLRTWQEALENLSIDPLEHAAAL